MAEQGPEIFLENHTASIKTKGFIPTTFTMKLYLGILNRVYNSLVIICDSYNLATEYLE